jgi:hypothetical protein
MTVRGGRRETGGFSSSAALISDHLRPAPGPAIRHHRRCRIRLHRLRDRFHAYAGLARTGQSLYGAAALGILIVNRNYSPRPSGWTIILLSAVLVALARCGRKAASTFRRLRRRRRSRHRPIPMPKKHAGQACSIRITAPKRCRPPLKAARKLSFSIRFSTTKPAMNHFDYRNGVLHAEAVLPNQIRIAGVCCGPTPVTSPLLN